MAEISSTALFFYLGVICVRCCLSFFSFHFCPFLCSLATSKLYFWFTREVLCRMLIHVILLYPCISFFNQVIKIFRKNELPNAFLRLFPIDHYIIFTNLNIRISINNTEARSYSIALSEQQMISTIMTPSSFRRRVVRESIYFVSIAFVSSSVFVFYFNDCLRSNKNLAEESD